MTNHKKSQSIINVGTIEQLAKTDKLDARLIVEYAARVKPGITPKKSKNLLSIKALMARRHGACYVLHANTLHDSLT